MLVSITGLFCVVNFCNKLIFSYFNGWIWSCALPSACVWSLFLLSVFIWFGKFRILRVFFRVTYSVQRIAQVFSPFCFLLEKFSSFCSFSVRWFQFGFYPNHSSFNAWKSQGGQPPDDPHSNLLNAAADVLRLHCPPWSLGTPLISNMALSCHLLAIERYFWKLHLSAVVWREKLRAFRRKASQKF